MAVSWLTVPTVETVRTSTLCSLLFSVDYPVLLMGNSGTGKTVIAKQALEAFAKTNKVMKFRLGLGPASTRATLQGEIASRMQR